MASASKAIDLFSAIEKDKIRLLISKCTNNQAKANKESLRIQIRRWYDVIQNIKKAQQEIEQRTKLIEIMKNSTRGQRSTMEKETIRRYLTQHMTCLPKTVNAGEMDKLCNELDWFPFIGRSILFLQGDFGNVYYMIANGAVGLYLEPSKDREMVIAREFGTLRGQPFGGTDEDLKRLGNNIFNLPKGAGFGEYAILAATNKIRSCAAVAMDANSLLLIMHAETYNAVLRQHHYRQKQLSSATSLLSELPLFKNQNYSKIASIAYTMKSQTYSSGTTIIKQGDIINNVLLIASGQVKVFAPINKDSGGSDISKVVEKRLPKLAVAMLGRGQIIGESEVMKGLREFQMTYETSAASTEILEVPATVFKDSITNSEVRQSGMYKSIESINTEMENTREGRLTRAYDAMKKMVEGESKQIKNKEELMSILPTIIDPTLSCTSPIATVKARRDSLVNSGIYSDAQTTVTRKSLQFSTESTSGKSNKMNQIMQAIAVINNVQPPTGSSSQRSSVAKSPRKLTFSTPL